MNGWNEFVKGVDDLWKISRVLTVLAVPTVICLYFAIALGFQALMIWGLNTLFSLGIEYNIVNCVAMFVVTEPLRKIYDTLSLIHKGQIENAN